MDDFILPIEEVKNYVGKKVFVIKKDGNILTGKLVRIKGNKLHLRPNKEKNVKTKALIPLVLSDLLAVGPYEGDGGEEYGYREYFL